MEHPYGWLSLLPPLVAIVLAIVTGRVLVSLLLGIFGGVLLTTGGDPVSAIAYLFEVHLWQTAVDESKLRVAAFTLLMGAMVGVISRSGGMQGLVAGVSRFASSRRRGQVSTWFLGLLIFFDDYSNTVLLGNTLRPLCDRLRISREKLAYLVDSTSAPVAGLALISTWVATEIEFVRIGLAALPATAEWNATELFVSSIPYRFYVLFALAFVLFIAISGRDFGPMLTAERRDRADDDEPALASDDHAAEELAADPGTPTRWYNAIIPIIVTVAAIVALMYKTGYDSYLADNPGTQPSLQDAFGLADPYLSLVWGSLAGFVTSVVLARGQGLLEGSQLWQAAGIGARLMLPALAVLWLASALSNLTGDSAPAGFEAPAKLAGTAYENQAHRLYTGQFLQQLLIEPAATPDGVPTARFGPGLVWLLPTIVFLLASFVAFSTGTSWGTMGILMPMVIPLAANLTLVGDLTLSPDQPLMLASVAGVLAGAIFGDHCSPISDTTVLSSQACRCDHIAHVRTQLPYALVVAAVAVLCGTLPVGLGISPWLLLPMGLGLLVGVVALFGRPIEPNSATVAEVNPAVEPQSPPA